MEHDTTIEAIELAALEPGGLDRLMAGDTETSRAVAAHLAGCASRARPPRGGPSRRARHRRRGGDDPARPSFEARTLALVRRLGRTARESRRSSRLDGPAAAVPAGSVPAATADASRRRGRRPPTRPRPRPAGPDASTFAGSRRSRRPSCCRSAVTSVVVADRSQAEIAAQADTISDLEHITSSTMAVASAARFDERRPDRDDRIRRWRLDRVLAVERRARRRRDRDDRTAVGPGIHVLDGCRWRTGPDREDVLRRGAGLLGGRVRGDRRARRAGDVRGVARRRRLAIDRADPVLLGQS